MTNLELLRDDPSADDSLAPVAAAWVQEFSMPEIDPATRTTCSESLMRQVRAKFGLPPATNPDVVLKHILSGTGADHQRIVREWLAKAQAAMDHG